MILNKKTRDEGTVGDDTREKIAPDDICELRLLMGKEPTGQRSEREACGKMSHKGVELSRENVNIPAITELVRVCESRGVRRVL